MEIYRQKEAVKYYVGMELKYTDIYMDIVEDLYGIDYEAWEDEGLAILSEYILLEGVRDKLDIFLKDDFKIAYDYKKSELTKDSEWEYEITFYIIENTFKYKDYKSEDIKRYVKSIYYNLEKLINDFIEEECLTEWNGSVEADLKEFLCDSDFSGHELEITPSILTVEEVKEYIKEGII